VPLVVEIRREETGYFPDGATVDLGSFYNGTCPGGEYYEQAAWMAEANRFLDGDGAYYSPYISNQGRCNSLWL